MPSFTPSLTELVNHGHSAPILLHDVMAHRQSIDNYPSASERRLVRQRSQLNLAILSNLADVARAIFPDAVQQNRRIESGSTRIYLDTDFDPAFPGGSVNPGYWMNGSIHDWCTPPETGDRLTSLYARVRNVPEFAAEEILWNHLELVETFLPGNGPDGWIWETRPLIEPFHNPQFWFPRYSARPYLGGTNLPILWAVQDPSLSNFSIRYFSLFRRENGQAIHWVEALPPGELPLFGAIPMTPDKRLRIRIVPSEFDPRIGKIGNETFCAVPGGAASLARADLKALAGHYVHLELLPHELAHTPGIIDAVNRARAAEVTFSLVGHSKSFSLQSLREVASARGHNFPLPVLPEPIMPNNSLITTGSPLPPSNNPRRLLLEPVIPEGALAWLYAREKVGKTWLALSIAQVISQGGTLGPWQVPKPASVLYIDGEMHPDDLQTAIAKVARGQGSHATVGFDALCAKKVKGGVIDLLDPIWQEEMARRAKDVQLLILDNFYSLTNNNVGEFPDVLGFLQRLRALGTAVLVIDHTNRDGALQGAHTKERAAETVIEMRIPEGRSWRENVRAIEVTKARHYIPEPADYFLGEMVFTEESFRFEVVSPKISTEPELISQKIAKLARVVMAKDVDKLSYPKIQERLGIPRSTAGGWYKNIDKLSVADRDALKREIQRLKDERKGTE